MNDDANDKLTAIERLEGLLDDKDAEVDELRAKVEALEAQVDGSRFAWMHHVDVPVGPLPVPRLEVVYTPDERYGWEDVTAVYRLVYAHYVEGNIGVPLGSTRIRGNRGLPREDGRIGLPHRDRMHIAHDAAQLRLPAFAICAGRIEQIPAGAWPCKCEACSAIRDAGQPMVGARNETREVMAAGGPEWTDAAVPERSGR